MQHPPHLPRGCIDVESHGVGLHQYSPQVFQKVIVSAGGRAAGRKSVPIVYATGNSAACVTVAGIPSSSATSRSLAKCIVVQTDPRPRDRSASRKLQPAGMIDAQADAAVNTLELSMRFSRQGMTCTGTWASVSVRLNALAYTRWVCGSDVSLAAIARYSAPMLL